MPRIRRGAVDWKKEFLPISNFAIRSSVSHSSSDDDRELCEIYFVALLATH